MHSTTNHILVIGIDGVRYDTLCRLDTPGIDAIQRAGFLQPVRVNDAGPTISGPGWATIFTGVLATDHEIMDNDLSPNRLSEFPDVVHHIHMVHPEVATFVAASWAPLVSTDSGGPLFADGGFLPDSRHFEDLAVNEDDHDEQVTTVSEQFLHDHDGTQGSLVVTYLGAPDEIAHELGTGDTYDWAIRNADSRIERLLDTINKRTRTRDEIWSVIAVTDHGHVDEGGHGGDSEAERTAWIAACGPGISQHCAGAAPPTDQGKSEEPGANHTYRAPKGLQQADVAAHILSVLGTSPAAPAHTIGQPLNCFRG